MTDSDKLLHEIFPKTCEYCSKDISKQIVYLCRMCGEDFCSECVGSADDDGRTTCKYCDGKEGR